MKKRMTLMIIGLCIVFGGLLAFNVIKQLMMRYYFSHYQPPAVTVSSVTAVSKNWEPHLHAVGNFSAVNGVNVNSQASGNVVAIHFESGEFIEADQPLIDIDDRVEQATLKFNHAELSLKKVNHERQIDLLQHNATAHATVDESKAQLLEAEANVEKTLALIQQKHIRSPFAGQLGLREINLGEYITPGKTSIVTLQSLDPLYIDFYIPEQVVGKLHIHQTVTASLQQYPDLLFSGKITAINAKADLQTHNVKVQATFPNCPAEALLDPTHSAQVSTKKTHDQQETLVLCDRSLNAQNKISHYAFIPGMFASMNIEQPPIPNVVVLPSTAISYSLYGNSVFIIEKNNAKNPEEADKDALFVRRVFVSTGEQQGNETIITQGISAGQQVVSTGELKLQNGTRIRVNNDIHLVNHASSKTLSE
jgi:membrane fusion protein (multidrug efflux system)